MNRVAVTVAAAVLAAGLAAAFLRLPARTDAAKQRYRESPILLDRVRRGELPPVEQRLPEHPLVVPTPDGIGRYDSAPRTP